MRIFFLSIALLCAAPAAFADIAWQLNRVQTGTVIVMDGKQGKITHVKRSATDGQHVFDVFTGSGATAALLGSYTTDPMGNILSSIALDGATTRFEPHRCNRTLGTCRFTMIYPDGFQEQRTRITQPDIGGLAFKEYSRDGLEFEGGQRLDAIGGAVTSWTRNAAEAWKVKSKRIAMATH